MRNLLALIGFAVVTFVGVGWYLDWYKIQSSKTPDGHRHVDIDIHGKKINEDLHHGSERLHDVWEGRGKGSSGGSEKPGSER